MVDCGHADEALALVAVVDEIERRAVLERQTLPGVELADLSLVVDALRRVKSPQELDCMRDAAVGFQCPNCVHEGAKQTRSGRTAYGGEHSSNPALTSITLISINVFVWLLILGTNGTARVILERGGAVGIFPEGTRIAPGAHAARVVGPSERAAPQVGAVRARVVERAHVAARHRAQAKHILIGSLVSEHSHAAHRQ